MNPLFKISQEYTFAEYKKFTNAVLKWNIIILSIFFLFAFISGVLLIVFNGSSTLAWFLILFPIIYVINKKINVKKYYKSNKMLQDVIQEYEFYDEYFFTKNINSEAKIEYNKIYKMIENKTNFYILIAKNQGYIISKAVCSEELIDFLKKLKTNK